jgi:hypothetical protein
VCRKIIRKNALICGEQNANQRSLSFTQAADGETVLSVLSGSYIWGRELKYMCRC